MSSLSRIKLTDAIEHPVLAEPWTYFVTEVRVTFDPASQSDNSLYLTLVRDVERVALVFSGVQELEMEADFPYLGGDIHILDVAYLQYDGIRIRVTSLEQDPAIRFWARSVERVTAKPF